MPKLFRYVCCSAICLLLLTGCLASSAAAAEDRKVIGVAQFQTMAANDAALTPLITNLLTEAIIKNRSYRLIDQATLSQRLAISGLTANLYEQCDSLEADQLAGIHFLVAGIVKEADTRLIRLNGFQQLRARVLINVRLLHVPARQVVYAESLVGEASQTFLLERPDVETDPVSRNALLEAAAKQAVTRIAAKINSLNPMSGVVLQVSPADSSLIIDMGAEHGVAVGQEYQLYAEGSVLVHPVTNLEIGREKKAVAIVRITRAGALDASAIVVSGRISDIHPGLKAVIKTVPR